MLLTSIIAKQTSSAQYWPVATRTYVIHDTLVDTRDDVSCHWGYVAGQFEQQGFDLRETGKKQM